ncbi:MAG: ice-binding family protein [Pseudolabrys sp.]|nr:ice-binding family protein [Pseudolabrys sp.]
MAALADGSAFAQAPALGTSIDYAIISGTGITNTGPSVITGIPGSPGDIGSIGGSITGFPPGILATGIIHPINDAVTNIARNDFFAAYNDLAGRTPTANLTGQDLGGMTLLPGVYAFDSSANLTGVLSLNGLNDPSSIFIFNIGSTLTVANSSSILLLNGAQGNNVYWRVGSSATLGTNVAFTGNILALTSITLNTGASIICGVAFAQNGAVTLDTNRISLCAQIVGPATPSASDQSVNALIQAFLASGGLIPLAFINLFSLPPAELADALNRLSGEIGTGAAVAGVQGMNSMLSMLTNPNAERNFGQQQPPPRRGFYKAPIYTKSVATSYDPGRWGLWAAAYGGHTDTGASAFGTHDRSVRTYGYAAGLDYRLTPDTTIGIAVGGGGSNFGLSDGLGGGRSDLFQVAAYATTWIDRAYLSAAVAYGWHSVSTERDLAFAGLERLTADYSAHSIGGRLEAGYRFAMPTWGWEARFGLTPYVAAQVQNFYAPSYSESSSLTPSIFSLSYDAQNTTALRTEVGARADWSVLIDSSTTLSLRAAAAWAHDHWTGLDKTAQFTILPGFRFTVVGAEPATDLLLASVGADVAFGNGISIGAALQGEFAETSQRYAGTARVRYQW